MEEINQELDSQSNIESNLSSQESEQNNATSQDLLDVINHDLNQVSSGVIRLLIDRINQQEIFETIIKDFDNQKYVIGSNYVKKIELNSEDNFQETILEEESPELYQALESVAKAVQQYKQNQTIAQCCENIKNIALRPSTVPSFIEVRQPEHALQCYEFIIKNIDGRNYEIVNDHCPYILECTALNEEEQRIVLNFEDQENIATKINQKVTEIINQQSFAAASIVDLNQDQNLRLNIIDDLTNKICKLQAGAALVNKNSAQSKVLIGDENYLYAIFKNTITKVSQSQDAEEASTDLLDRLLLLDFYNKINEIYDVVVKQAENLAKCCKKLQELSKLQDKPDFIVGAQSVDGANVDSEESFLLIELDDVYFSINFDEDLRPMVYHMDESKENGEEDFVLLDPNYIEDFVLNIEERLEPKSQMVDV